MVSSHYNEFQWVYAEIEINCIFFSAYGCSTIILILEKWGLCINIITKKINFSNKEKVIQVNIRQEFIRTFQYSRETVGNLYSFCVTPDVWFNFFDGIKLSLTHKQITRICVRATKIAFDSLLTENGYNPFICDTSHMVINHNNLNTMTS